MNIVETKDYIVVKKVNNVAKLENTKVMLMNEKIQ